jgi:hypothetical protein
VLVVADADVCNLEDGGMLAEILFKGIAEAPACVIAANYDMKLVIDHTFSPIT